MHRDAQHRKGSAREQGSCRHTRAERCVQVCNLQTSRCIPRIDCHSNRHMYYTIDSVAPIPQHSGNAFIHMYIRDRKWFSFKRKFTPHTHPQCAQFFHHRHVRNIYTSMCRCENMYDVLWCATRSRGAHNTLLCVCCTKYIYYANNSAMRAQEQHARCISKRNCATRLRRFLCVC